MMLSFGFGKSHVDASLCRDYLEKDLRDPLGNRACLWLREVAQWYQDVGRVRQRLAQGRGCDFC